MNEIKTPFPWYDDHGKQNRFRKNCLTECDYKLITPRNAVLPFMFRRPKTGAVSSWTITNIATGASINLGPSIGKIKRIGISGQDYFYYDGSALVVDGAALDLPFGYYESVITFAGGGKNAFSEMFFIPENSFFVGDANEFLKLTWYSAAGDINPFYYSDRNVAGVPYFVNTVYLDTFLTSSEPEVSIDSEKDGDNQPVPTFSKAIIKHHIHAYVPDYLKVALVIMQIHDVVNLTTPGNLFDGPIEQIVADSAVETPGCMSTMDINFQENLAIINRATPVNLIIDRDSTIVADNYEATNPGFIDSNLQVKDGDTELIGLYVDGSHGEATIPAGRSIQFAQLCQQTSSVTGAVMRMIVTRNNQTVFDEIVPAVAGNANIFAEIVPQNADYTCVARSLVA